MKVLNLRTSEPVIPAYFFVQYFKSIACSERMFWLGLTKLISGDMIYIEHVFEFWGVDMRIEFVEALLMSRQDSKITVNIFSCRGGEGFRACQTIERACINKQDLSAGLEIKDKKDGDAIVKIGYSRLRDVGIMELGDLILTFTYDTVRIELAIKKKNTNCQKQVQ